jgi:hypothetical protein
MIDTPLKPHYSKGVSCGDCPTRDYPQPKVDPAYEGDEVDQLRRENADLWEALFTVCVVYVANDELPLTMQEEQAKNAAERYLSLAKQTRV